MASWADTLGWCTANCKQNHQSTVYQQALCTNKLMQAQSIARSSILHISLVLQSLSSYHLSSYVNVIPLKERRIVLLQNLDWGPLDEFLCTNPYYRYNAVRGMAASHRVMSTYMLTHMSGYICTKPSTLIKKTRCVPVGQAWQDSVSAAARQCSRP